MCVAMCGAVFVAMCDVCCSVMSASARAAAAHQFEKESIDQFYHTSKNDRSDVYECSHRYTIGIYIHKECVNTYVIGVYIYTCGGGGGGGGARARAPCTPRFWGVASAAMAAITLTGLYWCSPFVTTVDEACAGCGCVSGRNAQTSAQRFSHISPLLYVLYMNQHRAGI